MRIPALCLLVFALFSCLGCQKQVEETSAVWFVHATDPHLFQGDVEDKGVRTYQEKLNQESFSALIQGLRSLPGAPSKPSFLVITGDLGLDGVAGAAAPQAPAPQAPTISAAPPPGQAAANKVAGVDREAAVNLLAEQLKASPVKDIYLVLGNNDIKNEAPEGAPVVQTANLLAEVQKRIAGSGVVLHDLTSCYRDGSQLPDGCSFDIPGTDFRLIGFSSFSFKNKGENGEDLLTSNQKIQEKQILGLQTMVDQAGAQGKKVLIVTHIPEIDDPYPLGQFEGAGTEPKNRTGWARFSPWNVSDPIYQTWKSLMDSGTVAGVLAGHFHDSHKELYYKPYRWATTPPERADLRKVFLAPPLSVRFQDTSPIQARGFALFRLKGDEIRRTFYWWEPKDKTFKPDAPLPKPAPGPNPFSELAGWFWQVVLVKVDLARAVVIALALLAAFLTAVQLWEIPPPASRLTPQAPAAPAPAPAPGPQPAQQPAAPVLSSLPSNFVKTVLAGLGGMLALEFLGPIWNVQDINAKSYYVLMFIVFFFVFLSLYALLQGLIESLRSRIATRRQPLPPDPWLARRHGGSPGRGQGPKWSRPFRSLWDRLAYWLNRIWRWLLSLRSFTLVFLDTFFNVIRGRNQLRTKIFEDTIIDLHRSLVRSMDRIREEVDAAIVRVLRDKKEEINSPTDVRVNITILSEDESMVYYVSRERGSLGMPFDKHSVAWLSIYTGEARWFKESYRIFKPVEGQEQPEKKERDVLLLDNSTNRYPSLPAMKLMLGSYLQARLSPDYKGFVVLPVPLLQRGGEAGARRGAIQISFRKEEYLDDLWEGLDKKDAQGQAVPTYEKWQLLHEVRGQDLHILDRELAAVLHEALEVLGELLRSFNDNVFEDYIKPEAQPS
jgi:hypothetical protein